MNLSQITVEVFLLLQLETQGMVSFVIDPASPFVTRAALRLRMQCEYIYIYKHLVNDYSGSHWVLKCLEHTETLKMAQRFAALVKSLMHFPRFLISWL